MGYYREIIAYQNPNYINTQLVDLIKNLEKDGWSIQGRWDSDEITYTLNAGDWITIEGTESEKALEDLSKLGAENSYGGIQLKHKKLDRIAWLFQFDGKYRFE